MSPRHFSKLSAIPVYSKEIQDKVDASPNLWYAFTAITGIDKAFSHTALQKSNKIDTDDAVILPPASYYEED